VNVHYYEDGNVQLNTEFKKSVPAEGGVRVRAMLLLRLSRWLAGSLFTHSFARSLALSLSLSHIIGLQQAKVGENILKAIKRTETDFQNALDHSYTTMGDTTFKALRRVLPITRQKVDWSKINNYRIGSEARR